MALEPLNTPAQSQNDLRAQNRHRTLKYFSACLFGVCLLISSLSNAVSNKSDSQSANNNPLLGLTAMQIAAAYGKQRTYTITRDGKRIGTHTINFQATGNELTVTVDSSIKVRFLGVPVYRLSYTSTEQWLDDQLVSVSATTTENGKPNTVSLDKAGTSRGNADTHFASNHWHPGVLNGKAVFNTLTGENSNVEVINKGIEQVESAAGIVHAAHYQYEDDILANVWYDEAGLWLMMKFKGTDGSDIQYLRDD